MKRLQSFNDSPYNSETKPTCQEMAKSGFFFNNEINVAICHYCNSLISIPLYNEDIDSIHSEYTAKKCLFIRNLMGIKYIVKAGKLEMTQPSTKKIIRTFAIDKQRKNNSHNA